MVPATFVVLEALPLSANGKIDRKALPAPEGVRSGLGEAYVGARTEMEASLCGIWEEVLSIERVGVNDSFFQLGGHSLLAVLIVSRIQEMFRLEMPVRTLFEEPTITNLAQWIDRQNSMCDPVHLPSCRRNVIARCRSPLPSNASGW